MLAAVIHTLGQPPRYEEFAEPTAGPDEVLVNVRAAGLHPIVKALAAGTHYSSKAELPMIAGLDAVGTLPDGRRVYFGGVRKPWGTMAQQCAAPAGMWLPLPDGIDDVQAAAIANPGMSAWLSLKERAEVQSGDTVLVLGATGVAGRLALQAARLLGAKRVIGVGRNVHVLAKENVDRIIALGDPEEQVREAFAEEAAHGIDVVIDYLWGRPTELLLDALAKGFKPSATRATRLVEVGESAGRTITLPGATLRSIDLRLLGSGFGAVRTDTIFAAIPKLFEMAAKGTLRIDVEAAPLSDVEAAWNKVEKGQRLVFTV
jgi:NADPH:quinone reductase-like Zn-dependent oxidoreductase